MAGTWACAGAGLAASLCPAGTPVAVAKVWTGGVTGRGLVVTPGLTAGTAVVTAVVGTALFVTAGLGADFFALALDFLAWDFLP